jgi:ABC-type uncharacterized transport system ATPase subunit
MLSTINHITRPDLSNLPGLARTWLYISERKLTESEMAMVQLESEQFVQTWTAHKQALNAGAFILFDQVLVLWVDESQAGASGCSIDKSTHFVEGLGKQMSIDFFKRDIVFYQTNDNTVTTTTLGQLATLKEVGAISTETLVFDSLKQTVGDLAQNAWQNIGDSWQKRWL